MTYPLITRITCQYERDRWDEFRSQEFNLPQIMVCGDESIDEDYKIDGDVLYLKCGDLWEHLPEKMIYLCHALMDDHFKKYTHFVKCDADVKPLTSFRPERFKNAIRNKDYVASRTHTPRRGRGIYHLRKTLSEKCYWKGKPYDTKEFLSTPYALGGFGYVISRKSASLVSESINTSQKEFIRKTYIYEDSMIGIILNKHNIYPTKMNLSLIDTDRLKRSGRRRRRVPVRKK